jgi:hypothetical protein
MEIWVVIAIVVGIGIWVSVVKARQLREAQARYQDALAKLTLSPANNELRIAALDAGRHYADLARKAAGSKGRAIFDEVALGNDLNARSGAPGSRSAETRKCPQCAESVKTEARICRFCQHKLETAA